MSLLAIGVLFGVLGVVLLGLTLSITDTIFHWFPRR